MSNEGARCSWFRSADPCIYLVHGVKHIDHGERLPCDLKLMQESFAVSNWAACIRKDGTGPIVLRQALALDI